MTGDEREILLAAQDRAIRILAEARIKANRIAGDAETEAVSLLLEQQRRAQSLLEQQREEIAASGLNKTEADDLLRHHRYVAELLESGEEEVATRLHKTRAAEAVDVLMAGQREAAAVLLEAWMQVTEGRPAPESRSS